MQQKGRDVGSLLQSVWAEDPRPEKEKYSVGSAEERQALGSEARQEQAGKLCPYLEGGSVDRPLDVWRFLALKSPVTAELEHFLHTQLLH